MFTSAFVVAGAPSLLVRLATAVSGVAAAACAFFTVAAVILAVAAVLLFMFCDWRSRGGGGGFCSWSFFGPPVARSGYGSLAGTVAG